MTLMSSLGVGDASAAFAAAAGAGAGVALDTGDAVPATMGVAGPTSGMARAAWVGGAWTATPTDESVAGAAAAMDAAAAGAAVATAGALLADGASATGVNMGGRASAHSPEESDSAVGRRVGTATLRGALDSLAEAFAGRMPVSGMTHSYFHRCAAGMSGTADMEESRRQPPEGKFSCAVAEHCLDTM